MSGGDFGWDYPPGVTGNEPQITGLCPDCGGECEDGECPGPPDELDMEPPDAYEQEMQRYYDMEHDGE